MNYVLLDTSVLVALFDLAEATHTDCLQKIAQCTQNKKRLITTWPCITEASYLLSPRSHLAMLAWLAEGAVDVFNFESTDLLQFIEVMQQYSEPNKTLMDLADASLYWLANKTNCTTILTEDLRDFSRYRLPDGQRFEIL